MIFTFAFVRLERPSAPGPGSVTAVDIAASSSSVSSTRAFFEAGWVDVIEVALRARFRFFVRELPFFHKRRASESARPPGGGIVLIGKIDASWINHDIEFGINYCFNKYLPLHS